jgi:hypothetical protein
VARDPERGPKPLSWSLDRLAAGVKRVDLVGYAAVEAAWPSVSSARASGATPVRLARDELVVVVASGAHAARARRDASAMLRELSEQMEGAPDTLRVTVRAG